MTPEDLQVEFQHHKHTGTDSPQISYNDLLDAPSSAGWVTLATNKLTSADALLIDTDEHIGSISTDYDLFRVSFYGVASGGNIDIQLVLNNDSGANYDRQKSKSTGAVVNDLTTGGTVIHGVYGAVASGEPVTCEMLIGKALSGEPAHIIGHTSYYDVDVATLARTNFAGRWNNTSSKITRITISTSANSFAIGSSIIIEGFKN